MCHNGVLKLHTGGFAGLFVVRSGFLDSNGESRAGPSRATILRVADDPDRPPRQARPHQMILRAATPANAASPAPSSKKLEGSGIVVSVITMLFEVKL